MSTRWHQIDNWTPIPVGCHFSQHYIYTDTLSPYSGVCMIPGSGYWITSHWLPPPELWLVLSCWPGYKRYRATVAAHSRLLTRGLNTPPRTIPLLCTNLWRITWTSWVRTSSSCRCSTPSDCTTPTASSTATATFSTAPTTTTSRDASTETVTWRGTPRKDTSASTVIESSPRATTYRFMKGFTPTNDHFHARFVIKHSRDRTTWETTWGHTPVRSAMSARLVEKDSASLELLQFTNLPSARTQFTRALFVPAHSPGEQTWSPTLPRITATSNPKPWWR